jgi:hypothetical protein
MEQATRDKNNMTALEAQMRESYGRVVYSTKTHEKAADIYVTRQRRFKLYQLVLSAITTGGLITAIFGDQKTSEVAVLVAAILSTLLTFIAAYMKEVDFAQEGEKHKKIACDLWDVRESYLSLLADLHDGKVSMEEVRGKRDAIQEKLGRIYSEAPRTPDAAYKKAGVGLKEKEELTFSVAEIDAFLPEELRRGEKK